jgi:hypothetical protein
MNVLLYHSSKGSSSSLLLLLVVGSIVSSSFFTIFLLFVGTRKLAVYFFLTMTSPFTNPPVRQVDRALLYSGQLTFVDLRSRIL